MAELGDVIGALMSGLLRARYIADEQTAALAEHYKANPLLEGLSVPRIRVPELTIDLPILIEAYQEGEAGQMAPSDVIAQESLTQLKNTLTKTKTKLPAGFLTGLSTALKKRLELAKQEKTGVSKETAVRTVQSTIAEALKSANVTLANADKEALARDIRNRVAAVSLTKAPVSPKIVSIVRTADVKEQASSANVVRLKLTLKEEGLEWTTQTSESGGVVRTLEPE